MENMDIDVLDCDVSCGDALLDVFHITHKRDSEVYTEGSKNKIFHSHSSYECHIITSGKTSLTVQRSADGERSISEYVLKYRDLFIIPPQVGHFSFVKSAECSERVVSFTLKKTKGENGFFKYFSEILEKASLCPIPASTKLYEAIVNFCAHSENDKMSRFLVKKTLAYNLISALFEHIDHNPATSSSEKAGKSFDSKKITIEYLVNDNSTSLGNIAKTLGYTTRHTARLIKDIYGRSLTEIRTENMLMSAKDIIKNSPELSLAAVARKAGFADPAAMRTAFQKHEGTTPKEYKNELFSKYEK